MLDVIVLARKGFKSTDKPELVYLGDSQSEAKAAAAEAAKTFRWVYGVNGMITRNYKTNRSEEGPQGAIASAEVEQQPETESPKKKKSK